LACLGLIAGLGFLAWASTYKRARAIADIATSRIGAVAQGYVELVGRASAAPGEMLVTPFSGVACIWYRYRVYSKEEVPPQYLWAFYGRFEHPTRVDHRVGRAFVAGDARPPP
jgi:hypothetical protein